MHFTKEEGTTFDQISDLYDRARTSYPGAMVGDIVQYGNLKKGNRVLDVGCGTGQATLLFAEKGLEVVGLDIGQDSIELAKKKSASYPHVSFQVGSFEATEFPPASFDLIACGMAWHWIQPAIRTAKAREILKPNGFLALFWSNQQKEKSNLVMSIANVIDSFGHPNRGPAGPGAKMTGRNIFQELQQSPLFTDTEIRMYQDVLEFDRQRYHDLVLSYGWAQALPETQRDRLSQKIRAVLEKTETSSVQVPYEYTLVLARRKN